MTDTSTTSDTRTAVATVSPLNAEVLEAFDAAQAALAATTTPELLTKAYALTHKMHSAEPRVRHELRQSRDMITAELIRRAGAGARS